MQEEDLEKQSEQMFGAVMRWTYRASGVGAVVGAVWAFLADSDGLLAALGNAIGVGLGFAFLIALAGGVLAGIAKLAVTSFGNDKPPFKQGLEFAFVILGVSFFIDGALLDGSFLVFPVITVLTGGDWDSTYYGCPTEWITVEEGSYCSSNSY